MISMYEGNFMTFTNQPVRYCQGEYQQPTLMQDCSRLHRLFTNSRSNTINCPRIINLTLWLYRSGWLSVRDVLNYTYNYINAMLIYSAQTSDSKSESGLFFGVVKWRYKLHSIRVFML